MPLNSSNREYEILTDGELATILSYFQPEYVIDIVNNSIRNIYRPYGTNMTNLVLSYEMNFNSKLEQFPDSGEEIRNTRIDAYNTIISTICNYFNIMISTENGADLYTVAYYLYEFFISNFTQNLISFFSTFMINERVNLINYFVNNGQIKRSNISPYAKRILADQNLGILISNMDIILPGLVAYDFTINDIINTIYGKNTDIATLLNNTILDRGNFYKAFFCKYITNPDTFPTVVTMVRLDIQQKSDIVKIDLNKNEEDMEEEEYVDSI